MGKFRHTKIQNFETWSLLNYLVGSEKFSCSLYILFVAEISALKLPSVVPEAGLEILVIVKEEIFPGQIDHLVLIVIHCNSVEHLVKSRGVAGIVNTLEGGSKGEVKESTSSLFFSFRLFWVRVCKARRAF